MKLATRSRLRQCLPILAGWAMALALAAAPGELGNPFIRNYAPKEYGGDSQNWCVAQDGRGLVYVANNQGVLEYDGARWRLIRTPQKTVVRSLAADRDGKIFVGAVGEIGYLDAGEHGEVRFVSLVEAMDPGDRTFSDVWTTFATSRGVFFQSRERLYLYDGSRVRSWKASTTFHVAFKVGERLFLRQRGVGLMEFAGDRLVLLPGGERFANESVFTMLPLGRDILIGSRKLGLWRYDGTTIQPFSSGVDAFLKDNALYCGASLPDGTLALATITGGVVFLDTSGTLRGVLDRASGLLGDNVKFLYPDRQSSLWMALDNGISKVEWPSPLSILDERLGLKGTVWAVQRHQGRLFVATGQGAFMLDPAPPRPRFTPLEGVKTQSLSFLSLEDALLMGNSQGVFEIEGAKGRLIRPSSNAAISLRRSVKDPARVFVGMQGSLASLRREPGAKAWTDEGAIPGVAEDVYSMAEDAEGRLWLGLGGQGTLRVTFPPGWKGGASPVPLVERFGADQGLPPTIQTYAVAFGGDVVFTTHQGIFHFDDRSGRFAVDPRFAGLFPEGPRWIKALTLDARGHAWMDSIDEQRGLHETGEAVPDGQGAFRWEPAALRRISESAVESIAADADGAIWFGGPDGLFRFDPTVVRPKEHLFPALIRKVTGKGGIPIYGGQGQPPARLDLAYRENAPRFEFSAPSFDQEASNQYQVVLEGYDKGWSGWTAEAQKEYTNLRDGRYRFRVHAKNVYGQVGPDAVFPFRVLPPWYRTWWAYLLYLGLGSLALAAAFQARTRILRRRNVFLHARISEATEELQEREHQLERMNLDLQELNEQKNRYLGMVAHDLRNPLHGMLLAAEMIEECQDPAEAQRLAQQVSRAGEDMSLLIGRFLDIAAIDSGGIKPVLESFPLGELVLEAVASFEARAKVKELRLRAELPEGSSEVLADRKFMKSALENLLSNAVKFSPPGKEVLLRVEAAGGARLLSVIDQGPGFSEEDKQKLFGRFARLSARPTGGEASVGLGLSIIKHLVEAMGGRIWVESEPGEGAAFKVEVPVRNSERS